MNKHLACYLFFLLVCGFAGAQTGIKELVGKYRIQQDKETLGLISAHPNKKETAEAILALSLDTNITDHKGTVQLLKYLGRANKDAVIRQTYVRSLSEIMWRSPLTAGSVFKVMQQFDRKDFTQEVKDDLMTYIAERKDSRGEAILLLGFIGSRNDIDFLKNLEHYASIGKKDKYKVMLALVRLNDPATVEEFLGELRQKRVNDELVSNLLPDLIYTHNPEVYRFLLAELHNETPACLSANNDSEEQILCAYRILEQIAAEIRDFPVTTDGSGELAGDYPAALSKARQWYSSNGESFSINADHF